jgi:rare lipoprotein A
VLLKVVLVFPVHPTHIFVQAGAFPSDKIAERLRNKLAGVGRASISAVRINGSDLYRVRFGPIATVDEADNVLAKAVSAGAPDAKIIVD